MPDRNVSQTGSLTNTLSTHHEPAEPIGMIAEVHGPVVVIACDKLPPLRQGLCAALNSDTYLFEVHQHLDEHHARAITLHRTSGLYRGMHVFDTGAPLQVPVTQACLGRLLNVFGEPLDGEPPLKAEAYRSIH
jgi:F-type H+-transporting ATPase subunit beta